MTRDGSERTVMAELQLELVALRQKLDRSEEEVDRLRGLWPRAELQALRLDVAEKSAALAQLRARHETLLNSTLARLPRPLWALLHRLHGLARAVRLAGRVGRLAARLPQRLSLRRQRRADLAVIAASPLFDAAWYRGQAMGGDSVSDAAGHYVWLGHAAGHDPHPLFDGAWYAARHQQLGLANPFADYLRRGMARDEDPHPLFDTAYYLSQVPGAAGHALAHYLRQPSAGGPQPLTMFDPVAYPEGLAHWARVGAAQDRDPHPLFATAWYRRTWLADAPGKNPLAHWLREGAAAGLPPNPFGLDPARPAILPDPTDAPCVTIIVRRTASALDVTRCLIAVAHRSSAPCDVILAGPGSALAWMDGVRTAPDLATASTMARAPHLVLLDGAAVVHDGWLQALLEAAQGGAGLVGAKVLGPDGRVRSLGLSVAEDGGLWPDGAGQAAEDEELAFSRPVASVDPACLLVRRDAWDQAGGVSDAYASDTLAIASLAFSVREAGREVIVQPACVITALRPRDDAGHADRERFSARWAGATAAWLTPRPVVLILADEVPDDDDTAVARALHSLARQRRRVTLAPLAAPAPTIVAHWRRLGVEVLRDPGRLEGWLARCGDRVAETWSFRGAGDVPAEALLRDTGGAILLWEPGLPPPAWCDAALMLERVA